MENLINEVSTLLLMLAKLVKTLFVRVILDLQVATSGLHMRFMHCNAFFEELTLFLVSKVCSYKMQWACTSVL